MLVTHTDETIAYTYHEFDNFHLHCLTFVLYSFIIMYIICIEIVIHDTLIPQKYCNDDEMLSHHK